jgi:hypothetical protein
MAASAGQLAHRTARRLGGEPSPRHIEVYGVALFGAPRGERRSRGTRIRVVEDPLPQRRDGAEQRTRYRVGAAHFEDALDAYFGEQRREMAIPVGESRALALVTFLPEATEGLALHRGVATVAHDEEHRHVERPLRIVRVAEAGIEREGKQSAAIRVGVAPDPRTPRHESARSPEMQARVRKAGRDDRGDRQRRSQRGDHVSFVRPVEVHLQ